VGSDGKGARQENALALAGTRGAIPEEPQADVRGAFAPLVLSDPDHGASYVHSASRH